MGPSKRQATTRQRKAERVIYVSCKDLLEPPESPFRDVFAIHLVWAFPDTFGAKVLETTKKGAAVSKRKTRQTKDRNVVGVSYIYFDIEEGSNKHFTCSRTRATEPRLGTSQ